MNTALALALWVIVPVFLAGLTHVMIIKLQLFRPLANVPLDLGASVGGVRVFGANKTLRGALWMTGATALLAWVQLRAAGSLPWAARLAPSFQRAHPAAWGALAGAGYVAGELPNSFLKRRLGIAAGAAGRGALLSLFWVVDQVDSVVGVLLFLLPVWHPAGAVVAALFLLTLVVHPLVALVMYTLGLKARIG